MIFSILWEAAQKKRLILVEGGLCRFSIGKDNVIKIYEIIVLPEYQNKGVGTAILTRLKKYNPVGIIALCPSEYKSNTWWKKQGFEKKS